MKLSLILALIVFTFWGCSSVHQYYTHEETRELIAQKFDDSSFAHAHWGVQIESLTTGEVWYKRNSEKMFMPASNEKIPTTAAALISLGPEYKFRTQFYYSGEIVDSVLIGDLVVVGNGDPTFYTRFFEDSRVPFFSLADTLLQMGIREIDGDIIGDDNAFDDRRYGYGWSVHGLDSWYSAECGALQFNENYIDLKIIAPSNLRDSVQILPNVKSSYFQIINNIDVVDTGRTRLSVNRAYGTNEIVISGNLHIGTDTLERSPSIFNPTLFYTTVLKETLVENGIVVSGIPLDCDDIDSWNIDERNIKLLVEHESPKLDEIITILMKKSQNMYAETMVKTMGFEESGIGSFYEGRKVVEEVLSDFEVEPSTYAYMDGSGLSRYNFISPSQIVKILKGMRESEYWEVWKDALPIAGIDGTLKRRMRGSKAEGNVLAKTGTISNVRGLSGYLQTAAGEDIVFSFLVNGHLLSSRDTELITDNVLSIIAEYPYLQYDIE